MVSLIERKNVAIVLNNDSTICEQVIESLKEKNYSIDECHTAEQARKEVAAYGKLGMDGRLNHSQENHVVVFVPVDEDAQSVLDAAKTHNIATVVYDTASLSEARAHSSIAAPLNANKHSTDSELSVAIDQAMRESDGYVNRNKLSTPTETVSDSQAVTVGKKLER